MSDLGPTTPQDTLTRRPASSPTSASSAAARAGGVADGPPPPPPPVPTSPLSGEQAPRPRGGRLLATRGRRWLVLTAAATCAVVGIGVGVATSRSSPPAQPAPASSAAGGSRFGGASNARSGPATGGASGSISSISGSSFTLMTAAGQQVTVNEASSTTYQSGGSSIAANAIGAGQSVLVLGTTNGTTVTATQVIVQPTGAYGPAASAAAGVVPFQQGAPTTSKQVGQIPANYSQGSGTIVSGTTANQATAAALAAYPGGVVDRVVQLSNGEYEVHYIGVNWPHHVFVSQDFKVVGAF